MNETPARIREFTGLDQVSVNTASLAFRRKARTTSGLPSERVPPPEYADPLLKAVDQSNLRAQLTTPDETVEKHIELAGQPGQDRCVREGWRDMTDTQPSTDQPPDSVERSQLARAGEARISAWAHGAQALALLTAAHERGRLTFLSRPRTSSELAAFTGMEDNRLAVSFDAIDAREFEESEGFDACFWAQPFFPAETRADTLRMVRRALKPGGILIEQEQACLCRLERAVRPYRRGPEGRGDGRRLRARTDRHDQPGSGGHFASPRDPGNCLLTAAISIASSQHLKQGGSNDGYESRLGS
ncbi:hypothetical protein ACGFIE_33715 [Micromonospora sp. NPDC049275]|uniref:hypothetical protein n=1 Tax=Micromonospora sp. NPDC049275 TaxID=3364268 RepID=UPI00371FBE9C